MERKLSRRNILGAASAFAGGSAFAGAATAATPAISAMTASGGDTLALSLFRQWIAAADEYDQQFAACRSQADYPAGDLMTELEDRILETSGGPVSLAIKTLFRIRQDHAAWTGETRLLRIEEAFTDESGWDIEVAVSILRDAAVIVPEIGELAAPVLHEDAPLIDAEIGVRWCRDRLAEEPNPGLVELFGEEHEENRRRKVEDQLSALLDRVATTEAKTARGRAIKSALGFLA